MHIVIYGVYLLARILGYRHFKENEEDNQNIKTLLSFFILPIFWLLFATSHELSITFQMGVVSFIICIIMAISKNTKLILINIINIGELLLFGFPSLIGTIGLIGIRWTGDELYLLFWKILSW